MAGKENQGGQLPKLHKSDQTRYPYLQIFDGRVYNIRYQDDTLETRVSIKNRTADIPISLPVEPGLYPAGKNVEVLRITTVHDSGKIEETDWTIKDDYPTASKSSKS